MAQNPVPVWGSVKVYSSEFRTCLQQPAKSGGKCILVISPLTCLWKWGNAAIDKRFQILRMESSKAHLEKAPNSVKLRLHVWPPWK